jgi:2-polyprenyl-6-methoxyphenol hydroxylase-like FAD-dependent oxidoreductase
VSTVKHALIIGGGIAGPAAALALRKAGIRSTIYESYPGSADGVGAGLMLAPNGLAALKLIGVDAQLQAVSQPIHRMVMASSRGKALQTFDGLEGLPPSRVVWRSDLYRVLREAVEDADIPIVYGKRLVHASEAADGVSVQFADGSQAFGDILIGADGIRSTVRELIDPAAPAPQYAGFLGFGGGTSVDPAHVPVGSMSFVFGKHAFLGYWADPDLGICWFGSLPHDMPLSMTDVRKVPAAEWLQRLRELYRDDEPAQSFLRQADPGQLLMTGASEMMPPVPRWHSRRMVLVGDAVHAPSSSSGQGASLAIESAVQLARCLRDVPNIEEAFKRYEQLRRPRVEEVAAAAAKTNSKKASGPVAKALTHMLMPVLLKLFFNPAKVFGAQHTYRIDWDTPVGPSAP